MDTDQGFKRLILEQTPHEINHEGIKDIVLGSYSVG